ncbi:MAG: glycerol-3-phosphate 1-O-acyltransferase PlsY [Bacillota bacterium]|nr:glycerol-3-phosphate 1-O-acyltransferase PlsY [Bacillota bacterium]
MKYLIIILISYFIGNISNAYFIGKIFLKKDVRNYGSGNAGATNAIRAFGYKVGILVFLGDLLKGVLATYISHKIDPVYGQYIGGIALLVGHNWPAVLKFKGGKGIASSIGVMLFINPYLALICFFVGLTIAISTKIVSIGSLIGVSLAPIIAIIFFRPLEDAFLIFTITLSLLAIFRHKENIVRLIKGEEKKLKTK